MSFFQISALVSSVALSLCLGLYREWLLWLMVTRHVWYSQRQVDRLTLALLLSMGAVGAVAAGIFSSI